MAQVPNLPRELRSAQVIVRFFLRTIILAVFKSLAALLGMSIILSSVVGAMRREPPFDAVLNHWDETVAYAALFSLVSSFNQVVPV